MSSSHQEPWNLVHAAKHWKVLKGQAGCTASSSRPLEENPSRSLVQNPDAPSLKMPETLAASTVCFLAWDTAHGALRMDSSCT